MINLIFGTSNQNKVVELTAILPATISLRSLADIQYEKEIPETSSTIEGNAIQKVQYLYDDLSCNCLAEDSGLEIDALNGDPGIFSARYAGPQKNATDNINLVLKNLEKESAAQFRTVIALIYEKELYTFEGMIRGKIILEPRGDAGFGYDPIFVPDGYHLTFAELSREIKNSISHRFIATQKLVSFLQNSPK